MLRKPREHHKQAFKPCSSADQSPSCPHYAPKSSSCATLWTSPFILFYFIITHTLTLSPLFCYYKYALPISHSLQSILVLKSLERKAEKMKLHFTTVVVCSLILSFSLLEPAMAGSRKILVDLTGGFFFFLLERLMVACMKISNWRYWMWVFGSLLWQQVCGKVQASRSAGPVLEVLRDMLWGLQVCAFWDLRKQAWVPLLQGQG